ncbi:MAG: phosphatase PAP2 family protein [Prevotella sp.]|nr:phosphatase PAP2 family protein [Candidatus Prevotella equi]
MQIETIDQFGIDVLLGSNNAFLDHFALTMTNAFTWVPLYIALLVLVIKNNDNMQQIALCFFCGVLGVALASIMADVIVKPWVARLRPCNEPTVKYLVQIAGNLHNKDYSFFSAHAANTMSLAIFFSLLVRSAWLSLVLVGWSLLNCWTRLYLGQHYMTDIMVGLSWGVVVGIVCYLVHWKISRNFPKKRFVSSQYTSSGYTYLDIDVVFSVIAMTVAYAMLPMT